MGGFAKVDNGLGVAKVDNGLGVAKVDNGLGLFLSVQGGCKGL